MIKLSWFGVLLSLLMFAAPVRAQDDATAAAWQTVINGQIAAFQANDATAALSFATAPFHDAYTDPKAFVAAIVDSGYSPIIESRSHSFGRYQIVSPGHVLQDVKFVGNDQSLYEAIYQLDQETAGWRVQGVQLMKTPGVGV
jgi:hypothetical protein